MCSLCEPSKYALSKTFLKETVARFVWVPHFRFATSSATARAAHQKEAVTLKLTLYKNPIPSTVPRVPNHRWTHKL
jgi:hypothetical protein